MKSIFKYRPLNELLFKELFYQELYFASYTELNDPLDLSARVEFSCSSTEEIKTLLIFLTRTSISFYGPETSKEQRMIKPLLQFISSEGAMNALSEAILNEITLLKMARKSVWAENIPEIVNRAIVMGRFEIEFNFDKFNMELDRLTQKFLQNSHVSCFSERNDDFLMWSHYASRHAGICLEFQLNDKNQFAFEHIVNRNSELEGNQQRSSSAEIQRIATWSRMKKVRYKSQQAYINFFEFAKVFFNEADIDLITLAKPWAYTYAQILETLFATKTLPWQYEQEWRIIDINFERSKTQEERIRHYPIESLKAIYFGSRMPEEAKRRIFRLYVGKNKKIPIFQCSTVNGKELQFTEWEYFDEF